MLAENDKKNLIRNLERNRVVLVTGAGFSRGARNSAGNQLPDSEQLAASLWQFLYGSDYDKRTPLKTVYGAALTHPKGQEELRKFMRSELGVVSFDDWYSAITQWYWHRIYTFNADDLLERVYQNAQTSLRPIVAPSDFEERDQFLRAIQYVKLHGSILSEKQLTFAPKEYASRAASAADIWYLHFVGDYSTLPTIFVGTQLDEPIFWQYIEARGRQNPNSENVRRAKCFLVSPTISKPTEEMLAPYNILPVRATGEDFFRWLREQDTPKSREETLELSHLGQDLAIELSTVDDRRIPIASVEYFYSFFQVPHRPTGRAKPSLFLFGAPPTWDDIAQDLDAHRTITDEILEAVRDAFTAATFDMTAILSAAGGGKSAILRRLAITLVDEGFSVYFSPGDKRPDARSLAQLLLKQSKRTFLFFDNAGDDLAVISDLWKLLNESPNCPHFVVAVRSNDYAFRAHHFAGAGAKVNEISLPNLSHADIVTIIKKLETHNALGVLAGKSNTEQIALFEERAKNQILVAMREATTGRGFDEILRDEYAQLASRDAQLLYLMTAITTNDEYGLSSKQMVMALDLPPNQTLLLLEKSLKAILLQDSPTQSAYFVRHPTIALFIIDNAPREMLAEAMASIMTALVTVIPRDNLGKRRSRAFRVYRKLLNHTRMQYLFPHDPELVRSIYSRYQDLCAEDGHYWLHFASFEIEQGGDLDLAESYLQNANARLMDNRQLYDTAVAHLLFRKALAADTREEATAMAGEALKILREKMADQNHVSIHSLHIFGSQVVLFIKTWVDYNDQARQFREAYDELKRAIPDAMMNVRLLQDLLNELKRSEIETAIPRRR